MNIIEYWREFMVCVGLLSAYAGGRRSKEYKEKMEGAGSIKALQEIYDKYIEHNKQQNKELTSRVNSLEIHNRDLQKSFNDMSSSYAKVMRESEKFEIQYNILFKEYEQLKVDHDRLKLEFDKYKKSNKG